MQERLESGMRLMDVVISHPTAYNIHKGRTGHAAVTTGAATAAAEKAKWDMYNKQYALPPGSLIAFELETYGTWGQGAASYARMVATGDPTATATTPAITDPTEALTMKWFVQRVSVTLQRGNFQAVLTLLDPKDKRLCSRAERAARRTKADSAKPNPMQQAQLQEQEPQPGHVSNKARTVKAGAKPSHPTASSLAPQTSTVASHCKLSKLINLTNAGSRAHGVATMGSIVSSPGSLPPTPASPSSSSPGQSQHSHQVTSTSSSPMLPLVQPLIIADITAMHAQAIIVAALTMTDAAPSPAPASAPGPNARSVALMKLMGISGSSEDPFTDRAMSVRPQTTGIISTGMTTSAFSHVQGYMIPVTDAAIQSSARSRRFMKGNGAGSAAASSAADSATQASSRSAQRRLAQPPSTLARRHA